MRTEPELKFENYKSVQHRLQFSGIKKGAKISFHRHFNEAMHGRPIINPFCSYTPTAVSRHFLTSGHAEDHLILIPLEQLHASRDSIRKAREAFLIHSGNTLEPAGLKLYMTDFFYLLD